MEVKYKAGYAKSGRSSCHSCKGNIPQFKLRLGKNTPSTFFDGYQLVWHHPNCLIKKDKGNIKTSDNIEGFENLKFEDQQKIRSLLGEAPGVQDAQAIASNKHFWEVKNKVSQLSLPDLKALLEYNGCPTTGGSARLIFKCTEGITYGVPTCPSCNQVGQMNYAKGKYTCEALLEWGKCGHVGPCKSITSWRFPPTVSVPSDLRNTVRIDRPQGGEETIVEGAPIEELGDEEELDGDNQEEEELEEDEEENEENEENEEDEEDEGDYGENDNEEGSENEESEDQGAQSKMQPPVYTSFNLVGQQNSDQPLSGITFAQAGRLSVSKRQLIQFISAHGGAYSNSITNKVDYVLATASEVERGRRKIKTAQMLGLPIVVELFLHRLVSNSGTFDPSPYQLQYKSGVVARRAPIKESRLPTKGASKKAIPTKKAIKVPKGIKMPKKAIKVPKKAVKAPKKTFKTKAAPKKEAIKKSPFGTPFGAPTPSPFGAPAPSGFGASTPSLFGAPAPSGFGAFGAPTPSLFGAPAPSAFGAPTPSLFGAPTPSPFGAPAPSAFGASTPSPFGAPAPSLFGAPTPSLFGTTKPAPSGSGGRVDPEAKCPPTSRIFVDGNDVYNIMLNQTDIVAGVNKYFKLQLIDVDGAESKFAFFAKWGRVGTEIGMSMKKDVTGKKQAIALFAEKYKDKTGNDWSARANFAKKPGKYFPIELEAEDAPAPASAPASSMFGAPTPSSFGGANLLFGAPAASPPAQKSKAKVDTNSGHAHDAHVLEDQGIIYDAMLAQTNIGGNNNKFYVIQVLESNSGGKYWAWNRWGRVGETGQSKLLSSDKNGAIEMFKKKFLEKTANRWEQRDNFQVKAGKYTLLSMEYEDAPEIPLADLSLSLKSALDPAVHDLVNMIFDVKMMNQTLADLNIDVRKMPLGKISKSQILKGYDILTKIDVSLKQANNRGELTMLSNQFYTLIPHDFGRKIPEIIDNVTLLKLKMKQMETLIEIQVASALLQEAAAAGIHPTDAKYNKLGTKIEVLPSHTQDFAMIRKYLANTYEPVDSPYTLELENVFVINRDGEEDRFASHSHLDRQLLWHGSRLSNWVGIISQGLRIAPPEAPKTGYMFGKGVYFGDMVAKSAEYCFTTPSSNTGLLLLSKVALGTSYELTQPHYMEQPPANYHSCHALAQTMPDPIDTGFLSDMTTKVPFGRGIPSNVPDAFLSHGEYVVYDVAQINMKYLLRVKFHHK